MYSDVNDENDVNMSGGVLVDVCSDVNIGKDRSTSEGVPAGMCSDVCNDVSTKNEVMNVYLIFTALYL